MATSATSKTPDDSSRTSTSLPRGMQLALSAARKGRGNVAPNPLVGAAWIDRKGRGIASYHARYGEGHAERRLLDRLSPRSRAGTLYLTLEPCSHHGKTPPCVERVIAARPSRVVIAAIDPNPEVSGRGVRALLAAGIDVEMGVGTIEAIGQNAPFFLFHAEQRAWVELKVASSLDGRIATEKGQSRWITGELARKRVHRQRANSDGIVVGAGTVEEDDPELTVRHVDGPEPTKIVVDSNLRVSPDVRLARAWQRGFAKVRSQIFGAGGLRDLSRLRPTGNFWPADRGFVRMPRLVLATVRGLGRKLDPYREAGWEVWELASKADHVSLNALTRRAASEGLLHLFVEGGPGLSGALLDAGLVDQLDLYTAPKILGGSRSWSGDYQASSLRTARTLERVSSETLGEDVLWTLRRRGVLEELAECSQDWSKNLGKS